MTEKPIAEFQKIRPCVNGCAETDLNGVEHHLRARENSQYCDRCFNSTEGTLRRAGDLVGFIVTQIGGIQSKVDDGSQRTKKNPPLPLNVEAFNDANSVYSALVYWCSLWATRLNRQAPGPAARAWRTENNRVVGLPTDISYEAARYAVSVMAIWLSVNLDDIYNTPTIDDIDYFRVAVEDDIYRLLAKWPIKDRPQYAHIRCGLDLNGERCNAKIVIWPPRFREDDRKISCDAGHVFTEDAFDRMQSLFRQFRDEAKREQRRAEITSAHLTRKWTA